MSTPLQNEFEQRAADFLRRVDARRDERNATMFRKSPATMIVSTTTLQPQQAPPPQETKEIVAYSPNSNAQGVGG